MQPMITVTLVTIAKTWKQLRYPLIHELIFTHTYIHNYSAVKKNEILTFMTTWMDRVYYAKRNKSD